MISGATETAYTYLSQYYQFPENVLVSHLPQKLKSKSSSIKILWAHHAYDQQVYHNFTHDDITHIVTPSYWAKETLQKYHKVPENKITVIPNGVDSIYTYSNQKQKQLIYTSIPYKALPILAQIIPLVHQRHPDAIFRIFSSMSLYGPQIDSYIELYEKLKALPNVKYSRAIDRELLIFHYQESAFFISPCIWEETFGVSMCEAMRCGAYPIITDIGALEEIAGPNLATVVPIEGTRTPKGYEVTEKFISNFVEATCMALDYFDNEKEIYNQVSQSCSDWIEKSYDWKNIAKTWENLIHKLQNKSSGVGFGNKILKSSSRLSQTYTEDVVFTSPSVTKPSISYFNFAKYGS